MNLLPKNKDGCPFLILAPMEGVGDHCFRKAMASIGGFDEAVTEFLRVPTNAHVESLAKRYIADETAPIPLAAQIMGSDPTLLAGMAVEIERRGAPRIDLNCGCPSNTVTGRGAGSSLLKDPSFLYENAKAIVNAVTIPVTIKMRSGYEDTSLFKENLLAVQESGASYVTIHPRTKAEGYGPPARWELIAEAKSLLKIPVVGNGDILYVADVLRMLKETNCDAIMIGRGSVMNPFVFQQVKAYFSKTSFLPSWNLLENYLKVYLHAIVPETSQRTKINKMKQLLGFLFKGHKGLAERRQEMLTTTYMNIDDFLKFTIPIIQRAWTTEALKD